MNRDEYRVMYEIEDDFWWYTGMRASMLRLLRAYMPETPGRRPRILDAGCGTGGMLVHLRELGEAVGVDISEEALHFCRLRGLGPERARHGSIDALPFPEASFDAAVSLDVLCDLVDDRPGFAELARVLRPGGILLLNLPAYQRLHSEHDLAVNNLRRYTRRAVRRKLAEAGLRPVRLTYANMALFPPAALVRLAKRARNGYHDGHRDREQAHSDLVRPHPLVNRALGALFTAEGRLIQRVNLPVGLSVVAVAQKP